MYTINIYKFIHHISELGGPRSKHLSEKKYAAEEANTVFSLVDGGRTCGDKPPLLSPFATLFTAGEGRVCHDPITSERPTTLNTTLAICTL